MLSLSEEALVVFGIKLGRLSKVEEYFSRNPHLLNEKIFPSSELGMSASHSLVDVSVNFDQLSSLKWAQSKGAIISPQSSPSLLLMATSNRNQEMTNLLLQKGFDPWVAPDPHTQLPPISIAVSFGWLDGLKQWKKQGVTFKHPHSSSLFYHIFLNMHNFKKESLKEVLLFLLKHKVPYAKYSDGLWPHEAAPKGPENEKLVAYALNIMEEYKSSQSKKMLNRNLKNMKSNKNNLKSKKM